jgi:hypothetical protein
MPAAGLLLLTTALGCARATDATPRHFFHPDYPAWSAILARFVDTETPDGATRVDYAALQRHPELIEEAVSQLADVEVERFDSWNAGERLAFLINAHNVHAVARILRHYPVASIEETRVWGSARRARDIRLLDRRWSLADLADEATSDRYLDARTIFLLNWTAAGCSPLPPVPVTEHNLTDLLDRQPRRFLADPRHCRYEINEHLIHLSPLLRDYRAALRRDFTTIWEFLRRQLSPDQAAAIAAHPPRIQWMKFDRSLNDIRD